MVRNESRVFARHMVVVLIVCQSSHTGAYIIFVILGHTHAAIHSYLPATASARLLPLVHLVLGLPLHRPGPEASTPVSLPSVSPSESEALLQPLLPAQATAEW